jgi:hypothetical protein
MAEQKCDCVPLHPEGGRNVLSPGLVEWFRVCDSVVEFKGMQG